MATVVIKPSKKLAAVLLVVFLVMLVDSIRLYGDEHRKSLFMIVGSGALFLLGVWCLLRARDDKAYVRVDDGGVYTGQRYGYISWDDVMSADVRIGYRGIFNNAYVMRLTLKTPEGITRRHSRLTRLMLPLENMVLRSKCDLAVFIGGSRGVSEQVKSIIEDRFGVTKGIAT